MQRTLTYILTKNKSKHDFDLMKELCHKSKNLYNYVNYIVRQAFTKHPENIQEFADLIQNERFISEYSISNRLCKLNQIDYRSLKAQSAQQVVKQVFKNHKAFFKVIQSYKKNKSKFRGCPKLPSYKGKNGMNVIQFTNQSASFDKHGYLKLDKKTTIKSVKIPCENIKNFQQVRIVPKNGYFQIEVVVNKNEKGEYIEKAKESNKKTTNLGIDIGVDNLATITSDNPILQPIIVNGRCLKSINQFFNKQSAKIKGAYSKQNLKTGKSIQNLNRKRTMKIKDYFHKASRRIVDYCILNNVKCVYIGHNDGWKQESNMKKQNNQAFVFIPFNQFISQLQYKLDEVGIEMKLVNEAYTSKCSALDNESIEFHEKYSGRRVKRGLYKNKSGRMINADVNGSLNILRFGLKSDFEIGNKFNPMKIKEINDISFDWKSVDRGCVFQPYNIHSNIIKEFQ